MSIDERPEATWEKRFMQRHYSYRDFHRPTALILTETQAEGVWLLGVAAGLTSGTTFYNFGTNARANLNPLTGTAYGAIAWPALCYGRQVAIKPSVDVWISIISLNPAYLKEAILQEYTKVIPTSPQLIVEEEQFVDADDFVTFYPTYGYGIIFRADSESGSINIYIEGNVEGGE